MRRSTVSKLGIALVATAALGLSACGSSNDSASSEPTPAGGFCGTLESYLNLYISENERLTALNAEDPQKAQDELASVRVKVSENFGQVIDSIPADAPQEIKSVMEKVQTQMQAEPGAEGQLPEVTPEEDKALTEYLQSSCPDLVDKFNGDPEGNPENNPGGDSAPEGRETPAE